VYRVTLPAAAFGSAKELAEQLLSADTPWADDVFRHDADPDLGTVAGGHAPGSGGIVSGPDGDTLVVVQRSSAVQIGDHNTQRNEFRIRVAPVTVLADTVGKTPVRSDLVRSLLEDPSDRASARQLAQDVACAASDSLDADLTARVTEMASPPQIPGWSGDYTGLTGRQIGKPGTSIVQVHVSIGKFDTAALARELREIAVKLPAADEPAETALTPLPPEPPRWSPPSPFG
jgi:hypothetical protein